LNWSTILNADPSYATRLTYVSLIVVTFFCLSYIFRLVGIVFVADQLPAYSDLLGLIGYVLSFLIILALVKTTHGALVYVAATLSAVPALVMIIAHFIVFSKKYLNISPNRKYIKMKYARNLIGLGFKYFLVQISSLVVFALSNAIIAQMFGLEQVTTFNIAYKYFSVVIMGFSIVVSPLWSASTDALAKQDAVWIKNTVKYMLKIWFVTIGIVVLMIVCADFIYRIWVGSKIKVSFLITLICGLYSLIFCWNSIFSFIVAGSGKMKLASVISIFNIVAYLPLAVLLGKLVGISGILLATCVILLGGAIQTPIQTFMVLNNKAKGIWNK
jgi:O-antigen/teichoic acid export membrane protein